MQAIDLIFFVKNSYVCPAVSEFALVLTKQKSQLMNKPKIAWKTHGGIKSASFRYRAFLPCKYLQQEGWSCEIFKDKNIEDYEIVVFQKLYDEKNFKLAKILKARGVKTIFDLCDNHFYYQLDNLSALAQRQERLQKMLDVVDAVSVSTPELKKLIDSKANKVSLIIDDAVEIPQTNLLYKSYLKLKNILSKLSNDSRSLNLVWYGNAGTENPPYGMIDLARILPCLEKVHREIPLNLTIISNSESVFKQYFSSARLPVKYYNWKLVTFPYIFSHNDVCLIPVNLNSHTRYKTNNRLVLSLLLNVAVIADKIPSYEEFDKYALFSNWETNLRKYALNSALRQQQVKQGRKYILSKYNRNRVIGQWSSLFQTMRA